MSDPLGFENTLTDLGRVLRGLDDRDVAALQQVLLEAPAVHVGGDGRCAWVARAFAMRLAQLGRRVFVLGEATTPALQPDELLLLCTAAGTSGVMKLAAEKAIHAKGRVALVTGTVISSLGRLADVRVSLPPLMPAGEQPVPPDAGTAASLVLPMRILFEQAAFLFLDALATRLMRATNQQPADLEGRLHNLD